MGRGARRIRSGPGKRSRRAGGTSTARFFRPLVLNNKFAGSAHSWSQTYVAQGRGLASARLSAAPGKTADGGWVQRVGGLERVENYRVAGRVRSSWALDSQHECLVGLDPTGQEDDARAATIAWTRLPELHGVWTQFTSEPIRPATNSISVWLRGTTTFTGDKYAPFKADFDDFALRRVQTGVPFSSSVDR